MTLVTTINEIVRRQVDAFNTHDPGAWASAYSPEAVVRDPYYPEPLTGHAAIQQDMVDFFRAFPDVEFEVTRVLSDEQGYAYECTVRGTHAGPLELPTGTFPTTNRRMEFSGGGFVRLDGQDRIVEEHRYFDVAGQMSQLGLT